MTIKSPITLSENVAKRRTIQSAQIIGAYEKELNINVRKYFNQIEAIDLYECLDSGYQFYHPPDIFGDGLFYEQLEKFPWYYMEWKWEHGIAADLIKNNGRILEIGCAEGNFLKKMKDRGNTVLGLEMNSKALAICLKKELEVHSDSIEKFSESNREKFNIVVSFQVLEHIPNVRSFIESSLKVLKPGGLMIISVPNNDSFLLKNYDVTLNMPPHHAGLWKMGSLIKLQNFFNLSLQDLFIEPLQPYHFKFANKISYDVMRRKMGRRFGPFFKIFRPFVEKYINFTTQVNSEYITGQTILAVYKKD